MSLPNAYQRKKLLDGIASDIRKYIPMEDFAAKTEGATCAQLADMVSGLRAMVDAWDRGIAGEEFESFIASQMVPAGSRDMLKQLIQSAQQLLQQLPDLMKNTAAVAAIRQETNADAGSKELQLDVSVLQNKENYLNKQEEQIKNM
jgi:hypothetical protein